MKYSITVRGLMLVLLSYYLLVAGVPLRKLVANKKRSIVTYTMHHPLHTWEGVSHEVNCVVLYDEAAGVIQRVAVAIRVASFDSKDANRDSHALEVLNGIRYPNVTFVSEHIQPSQGEALTAVGKLTFHGVTRPVQIVFTREQNGTDLVLNGAFEINMTDYKVEQPSLLGMKADDAIKLNFSVYFTGAGSN